MCLRNRRSRVGHCATGVGILNDRAKHAWSKRHLLCGHDPKLDTERLRPRSQHVDCLREAAVAREADVRIAGAPARVNAVHQRHGFCGGRRLVQQRCACDFHPGQIGDHRLKVEERFQPALCDLRLVRRVWRVPAGVLHDHPQNHARCKRVVVAEADVGPEDLVPMRDVSEAIEVLVFAFGRREQERLVEPDRGRDGLVHQRLERRSPDGFEHLHALVSRRSDVAAPEPVARVE